MSLPKLNEDVQIISKLADEPNDVGGLSADELKAKFDEASVLIKAFINDTLLPYLEGVSGAGNIGIANIPGLNDASTVQAALLELKTQLNNTSTGSIPDRSLSGEKLVTGAVGTNELANASVTSEKIANSSVDDSKISSEKLSGASIQDKAIENRHFNGKVIKAENVEDNTLTGDQMKDLSIPAGKLGSSSVQTSKIADGSVTRAKLAKDALYSPIVGGVGTRYITSTDIGKTLKGNWNAAMTLTITQENSANIPEGAEFAVLRWGNSSGDDCKIIADGTRLIFTGDGTLHKNGTAKISEAFGMIALKKTSSDSTLGDSWLVTGNVEVVS